MKAPSALASEGLRFFGLDTPTARWLVTSLAVLVFILSAASPIETVDSDPAIALLVSQSILDHRTVRLDVWRDEADLAYDLERDRRLRPSGESVHYFSLGVPVLSTPAVWVANRFGLHMLRQEDEFLLQNVLSAACVTFLFLLCYRLSRICATPAASTVIAVVSTLGSSLISTLATGLWNSGYAVALSGLALLHVARREAGEISELRYVYLASLAGLAIFCRPTTALFAVALLLYLAVHRREPIAVRRLAGAALVAIPLAVVASLLGLLEFVPGYYSPSKVIGGTWIVTGLGGVLLSPSRGLFVYSPFLAVVVVGLAWRWRGLRGERAVALGATWIMLHLIASAGKSIWWGGHSFGPRVLTETMPAFTLLTGFVWQGWQSVGGAVRRRLAVGLYSGLGLAAILVHSGQGLFNRSAQLWNERPNVDYSSEYLWSWRFPQFLATPAALEERLLEYQRRRLRDYQAGADITPASDRAVFFDWHAPEKGWRWSRGASSELLFRLAAAAEERLWVVELVAGSLGEQRVSLQLNGEPLAELRLEGFSPTAHTFVVAAASLRFGEENRMRFEVPGARSTAEDSRVLGVAFRSLRLRPLTPDLIVSFRDDASFVSGFSVAEEAWRWSLGRSSTVVYPYPAVEPGRRYVLQVRAGTLGARLAHVFVNDEAVGTLAYSGFDPITRSLPIDSAALVADGVNRIRFEMDSTATAPGDPRELGLAVVEIRLLPGSAGGAEGSRPLARPNHPATSQ